MKLSITPNLRVTNLIMVIMDLARGVFGVSKLPGFLKSVKNCPFGLIKELVKMQSKIKDLNPDNLQTELEILLDANKECKNFYKIRRTAIK